MQKINPGDKISYFIFKNRIGKGGFGSVYKCTIEGSYNQKFAALKIVSNSNSRSIEIEKKILEEIQEGYPHFPKLYDAAQCLGPSLDDIMNDMEDRKFSKFTLVYIALQTLECIKQLHSFGIIHCDIKPSNFLLRTKDNSICLTDFGLSTHYMINNRHINFGNSKCVGTLDFQSIASHKELTLSRKDDLESWIYSLLYLRDKTLPWYHLETSEVVYKKMQSTKPLLNGWSPFDEIFNDIYNLRFKEEPHYDKYEQLLLKSIDDLKQEEKTLDWDVNDNQMTCCTIC